MAARKVSNTLTRWHKVVERLKQTAQTLEGRITANLSPVSYSQLAVYRAEKEGVTKAAADALQQVALIQKLSDAIFAIRKQLAHANVSEGVSDLLATQVWLQQRRQLLERLLQSGQAARLPLTAAETVLTGDKDRVVTNFYFGRIPEETLAAWRTEIDRIDRELMAVTDKISDANATRWFIELDEEVLAHMGM